MALSDDFDAGRLLCERLPVAVRCGGEREGEEAVRSILLKFVDMVFGAGGAASGRVGQVGEGGR